MNILNQSFGLAHRSGEFCTLKDLWAAFSALAAQTRHCVVQNRRCPSFVAPSSVIDAGHALHEMCGDMAVAWMKSRGELDEVALGSLGSGFV